MSGPEQARAPSPEELPSITKAEADKQIAELLLQLPTRRAAKRVLQLYEQSGSPVAVFLSYSNINPAGEDIEQQFHGHYFGSYTRDEVIQTGIEIAEHDVALEGFLLDRGLPDNAAEWNFDALWPVIRDDYLIVQEDHYFHVFDSDLIPRAEENEEITT